MGLDWVSTILFSKGVSRSFFVRAERVQICSFLLVSRHPTDTQSLFAGQDSDIQQIICNCWKTSTSRGGRQNWRFSNWIRYEIGTTNAPRCQVPIWRDNTIGPKTAKNDDNYSTALKRNNHRKVLPVANWCIEWICRMWGGLGPHTLIIPASLSLSPMWGAAIGHGRAPTILQSNSFYTRIINLSNLQFCWLLEQCEKQPFLIRVNDLIHHTSSGNSADELWDGPCVWLCIWLFRW